MELREYLSILWRRWLVVFVTLWVTVLVTAIVTALMKPEYQASALVRVFTASNGSTYELDYSDRLMNTYAMIATGRPMLSDLAQRVGLKTSPQVTVQALANSELMQISVTYGESALAARAANTLATLLVAYGQSTGHGISNGGSAHSSTIVQLAYPPSSPVSPRKTINLAVGTLLGLVGGIGLAALFENLDPRSAEFRVNPAQLRDEMPDSFEDTSSAPPIRSGSELAPPHA